MRVSRVYVSDLPETPLVAFTGLPNQYDEVASRFEALSPQRKRFYVPDWYKARIAREGIDGTAFNPASLFYADGEAFVPGNGVYYDRLTATGKAQVAIQFAALLLDRAYERVRSQYGMWIDFIYANFKAEIHDKRSYRENVAKAVYCLVGHFMNAVSENQFQSFTLQLGSTNVSSPIDQESTRYWTVETLSYIASSGIEGLIQEFVDNRTMDGRGVASTSVVITELRAPL